MASIVDRPAVKPAKGIIRGVYQDRTIKHVIDKRLQ